MKSGYHIFFVLVFLPLGAWITCGEGLIQPNLESKITKVRKGGTLTLQCNINADTSHVIWYKDGDIVASVFRHGTGSCDWRAVTEDDNLWIECRKTEVELTVLDIKEVGTWICEDKLARRMSNPVDVKFHYGEGVLKPSLTVNLRSLIPGSILDLDCKVNINVKRVIWYHNEVSVADIRRHMNGSCHVVWHKESRFKTTCEGNSSRLLVHDVITSDGHAWYCYDSTHHVKSKRVYVTVLTPTDKPVLVTSQEVARLGSRMNLTCVLPYISPLVRWTVNEVDFGDATVQFIGGCKFQMQEELYRDFNFTCNKQKVAIAFMALRKQNGTKWRCQDPYRKLISPETEVKVSLPSIWPTAVELTGYRGSTTDHSGMTLTCACSCDHLFHFRWHFGNLTASTSHSSFDSTRYWCSQSLTLHPDWSYHDRTVRCLVTNTVTGKTKQGHVKLDVEYPPIPRVILEFREDENGSTNPVLICRVRANPREVEFSQWRHVYDGVLIRELQGHQNGMEYSLGITQPSYKDVGVYVCSVSNSVVEQTGREPIPSQIQFQPKGAPEFLDSDVLSEQKLNSTVTLLQRFITDSSFLKVTWVYNDRKLKLPSNGYEQTVNKSLQDLMVYGKTVEREVYEVTLAIDDVNEMTYGTYVMEVCNELGCVKTKDIYIHYDIPEVPEVVEEVAVVSSLDFGQILAFSVGLAVVIINILLIIFIIRRRRARSRQNNTLQVNPDVVGN